jgi:hypothetical protein
VRYAGGVDYRDGGEGWNWSSGSADTPPTSGQQELDPDAEALVAATVRLLHRRRGWAWTLGASLVAFVAFAAIVTSLWPNATGALEFISGLIFILLIGLASVALTAVITDTVRLRRREPSIRAHATSRTSHHEVSAHPFPIPGRHRTTRVLGWVALASFPLLTVAILPDQVNAIAYLAGAGNTVTFVPQSYHPVCSRLGCDTWTDGFLRTNPPVTATWPNQVPLGRPLRVRRPWWDGWGRPVLMNAGASGSAIAGSLFGDVGTILFGVGLVHMVRNRLRHRREAASMTAGR